MSAKITVGEQLAILLEKVGVKSSFGVISIHNMPFLDAIGRRDNIEFICARGEAGALNMADGCARASGKLGVAFTSTGTGAGNAAGALVEAMVAGTPLLHITGQVELPFLGRNCGYIHEARDQLSMLRAISKSAYSIETEASALGVFRKAIREALTAPMGPVSVEVPIDIQHGLVESGEIEPMQVNDILPNDEDIEELASMLEKAKRPLLWIGGGARHAQAEVQKLAGMGFGVVTSIQGRGVVPEGDDCSLGAYNLYPNIEEFYQTCDAMLVVGSRLRGNETLKYKLKLPSPLYQVDVDPTLSKRPYQPEKTVIGDSKLVLSKLAAKLGNRMNIDENFWSEIKKARQISMENLTKNFIQPYENLVSAIQASNGGDFVWVRDVTISNSTWGNRAIHIQSPKDGLHAVGGGIGQGLQMAIGAAMADRRRKVVCLVGDGGLQLNIGEMLTASEENANITMILMNSRDYEVIKNIQDAAFEGRKFFADIKSPEFGALAESFGWSYLNLNDISNSSQVISEAISIDGPSLVEVDMQSIGSYAKAFGGPPTR